jgi:hypothetical protein
MELEKKRALILKIQKLQKTARTARCDGVRCDRQPNSQKALQLKRILLDEPGIELLMTE